MRVPEFSGIFQTYYANGLYELQSSASIISRKKYEFKQEYDLEKGKKPRIMSEYEKISDQTTSDSI